MKKLIFESLILHGGPSKCSSVWLIGFWIVLIRCAQRCMDGIRFFFRNLKSFQRIWVESSSSDLEEVSKVLQNSTDLQENDISCYFSFLAFYQLYTLVIESFCRCLTISIRSVDCTRCMCTFQYKMFPFCASSIMVCVHLVSFHHLVGQGNIMNA